MISLVFKIILVVISLLYILLILDFTLGWLRLKIFTTIQKEFTTRVSVIVAARNEEKTIVNCLHDIVTQTFPKYLLEVIIVNDNSSDQTSNLIKDFISSGNYDFIKVIDLVEEKAINSYKKKAVLRGINSSSGELIITTDADCRMGAEWLASIVSYFEQHHPDFISAPVCYHNEKNWFGKFQTLEFLSLIGIGAAGISNNKPNMCNGANLAYSRKIFESVNGFKGITKLASGDDTFLMLKIANDANGRIHFLKSEKAIVYTEAKPTLAEFVEQRKRWASKGAHYNSAWVIGIAVLTYLFNFLIISFGIVSIFYNTFVTAFWCVIIAKLAVEFLFLFQVTSFFKRRSLLKYFLPEQLLYVFYIVIIGAIGTFTKYSWKGRVVE